VHKLNLVIQETHLGDDRKPSSVCGCAQETLLKPLDFRPDGGEGLLYVHRELTPAKGRLLLVWFEFSQLGAFEVSQLRAQVFDPAAGGPS
jgi:hypothetical protein